MKKIILTGGGTAGHVTPNIAILKSLKENNYNIEYIGSIEGIEKNLIKSAGIKYYAISSGKLRRYLDFKNFTDLFRIIKGLGDAYKIIKKTKPDVIFSKGGFVTVPVVIAGKLNKVPVIIHESDISCGLANKISIPFAKKVCCTFPETLKSLPKDKGVLTGTPVREELFFGKKEIAYKLCSFENKNPVILVMGGSLGSAKINVHVRESLEKLLPSYNIIHLCGKGKSDENLENKSGYKQFEYVAKEFFDLISLADIVVSRAGANSIYEFLALKKPNLLIPLSKEASRGDQILNANSFSKQGFSKVIFEENLNTNSLLDGINQLYKERDKYIKNMEASTLNNGIEEVIEIIKSV